MLKPRRNSLSTFALPAFVLGAVTAGAAAEGPQPQGATGEPVTATASTVEFVQLQTTELSIDCGDLGGPGYIGEYVSADEVGIEVVANVPLAISYAAAGGLSNGFEELPTWVQVSAAGRGRVGDVAFHSPGTFTGYSALPAYQLGAPGVTALYDRYALASPSAPNSVWKALRFRLLAQRRGLLDAGGHYNAQLVVTCSRM